MAAVSNSCSSLSCVRLQSRAPEAQGKRPAVMQTQGAIASQSHVGGGRREEFGGLTGSFFHGREAGSYPSFAAPKHSSLLKLSSQRSALVHRCSSLRTPSKSSPLSCRAPAGEHWGALPCRLNAWPDHKKLNPGLWRMKNCSMVVVCSAGESPGFNSSIIEQEAFELSKLFATLGPLQAKYFDFDLEGKKIFCAQMEAFLEKLQVFTTR